MKEYARRWNAPLVNPGITLGEYEASKPKVPYSELAMRLKIAGKPIQAHTVYDTNGATVKVAGELYHGTVSELLPFELR